MSTEREHLEKVTRQSLDESARQNHLRKVVLWFVAMVAGGLLGYLQVPWINELFNFIATVFTRLFQFVAVPVIALAVITTLASLGARRETGQIFSRAVVYTLATTVAAAAVALALFVWVAPANIPAAGGAQNIPANLGKLSYY
ncbi:MAG: cation:dicarboxylase symporter family transporter, partial [Desulfovibrio sp.]|nr:cation:dicarboxylase symporter family transporter [Desulfovibrio sp.]